MKGNEEKNNPVNIRFVIKASDIRKLPENITVVELHLCFVIKGNVWWKRTFLPIFTVVVLCSYSSHLQHMLLRGLSESF